MIDEMSPADNTEDALRTYFHREAARVAPMRDLLTSVQRDGRRRRRNRRIGGVMLVGTLSASVGALLLPQALSAGSDPAAPPAGSYGTHAASTPLLTEDLSRSPQLIAEQEMKSLPAPPHATELNHAPKSWLDTPLPPGNSAVSAQRWWTAAGTVDDALAFFSTHSPTGMTVEGGAEDSGPGRPSGRGLIYGARQGESANTIPLTIMVYPDNTGVIVYASVSAAGEKYGGMIVGTSEGGIPIATP
jgi:hypothetical protein